jgi:tetratricopeptide (TPR) repeat protein
MTFGRWLLVHSFSIFLVGLLVVGYLYRDELQLEQAYQQLLNLDRPTEVIESLKLDQKKKPALANTEADEIKQPMAKSEPEVSTVNKSEIASIQVTPTIKQAEFSKDDLLFDARQAYWERDYKGAIGRYQQLINRDPQNPDYSGELGNVYYAMNDHKMASELYFRTAQLLLHQGQRDAAAQLLSPLNAMNRELGDKLKRGLMQ